MEMDRFDSIARLLASKSTRRRAMIASLAGTALTGIGTVSNAVAQGSPVPDSNGDEEFPEFLYVQTFGGGAWAPKVGEDGAFTLTLSGVAAQTVYFSDRPERQVGMYETQRFLDGLGFTPANPPNAAVVAAGENGVTQVIVLELHNPTYDATSMALTYDVRVLDDYSEVGMAFQPEVTQTSQLDESFSSGSVFIDGCTNGSATCYQIINGNQQDVGGIEDVGCCGGAQNRICGLCNDDGTSQYYGELCNRNYPDQCTYAYSEWGCFVNGQECSGT